jgi:hypothetical protein
MEITKYISTKIINFLYTSSTWIVGIPLALFGIVFSILAVAFSVCVVLIFGVMITSVCSMESCYGFLKKKYKTCLSSIQIAKTEIALLIIYTGFCIRNTTEPWV